MRLVNNLVFKGNCREAFEHYAEVLGGEIKAVFPFGEVPHGMPIDGRYRDIIMHAWLEVGDQAIMGCDAPPAYQQDMGGFSVAFHTDDPAQAKRVFEALAHGGKTSMPFGATFWSPAIYADGPLRDPLDNQHQSACRLDARPGMTSPPMLWAGRVLSGLFAMFMLGASIAPKLLGMPLAEQTLAALGWSPGYAAMTGVIELSCVLLYLIPRTSLLGAVAMTALLGGAIATHLRRRAIVQPCPVRRLLGIIHVGRPLVA